MILRLDCPVCRKDSYSSSVDDFRPCPYCGILFSGKYGIEKRSAARFKKEIPVVLPYKEKIIKANTSDFSQNGISLKIFDMINLPVGDIFNVNVESTPLKAQVIWSSNKPDNAVTSAGFKILNGNEKPIFFP